MLFLTSWLLAFLAGSITAGSSIGPVTELTTHQSEHAFVSARLIEKLPSLTEMEELATAELTAHQTKGVLRVSWYTDLRDARMTEIPGVYGGKKPHLSFAEWKKLAAAQESLLKPEFEVIRIGQNFGALRIFDGVRATSAKIGQLQDLTQPLSETGDLRFLMVSASFRKMLTGITYEQITLSFGFTGDFSTLDFERIVNSIKPPRTNSTLVTTSDFPIFLTGDYPIINRYSKNYTLVDPDSGREYYCSTQDDNTYKCF